MTSPFITLSIILTGIFWGLPPILLKIILQEFNTFTTIFIRSFFTLILVLPLILYKKAHLVQKKDLRRLLALSLLPTSNVILFIVGLQFTTAIVSNLMYSLVPVITLILALIFLKEKISSLKIIGLFLSLLGALVILILPLVSTNRSLTASLGTSKGNFIIFTASVIWTFYLILSKKLSQKYSPLTLSFFSFLSAPIVSFLPALAEAAHHTALKQAPTFSSAASFTILITFASIAPIFLNQVVIKHASPVIASMSQYVTITTTAILAIIFLSEKFTLPLFLGTILIILGVFLVSTLPHINAIKNSVSKLSARGGASRGAPSRGPRAC